MEKISLSYERPILRVSGSVFFQFSKGCISLVTPPLFHHSFLLLNQTIHLIRHALAPPTLQNIKNNNLSLNLQMYLMILFVSFCLFVGRSCCFSLIPHIYYLAHSHFPFAYTLLKLLFSRSLVAFRWPDQSLHLSAEFDTMDYNSFLKHAALCGFCDFLAPSFLTTPIIHS